MTDMRATPIAKFIRPLRVRPGTAVKLSRDFDPGFKAGLKKKSEGLEVLHLGTSIVAEYQARLAAQDTEGLLVCLQALDAGGKDGTIRHVMSGVNPQGVRVCGFKVPSSEELNHDFLWRYAKNLPTRGEIGIFNRSHYEEVVVVRVHPEILESQRVPPALKGEEIWDRRYQAINDWERYLAENGFRVLKLFLTLSKEEQRARFLKRIELPDKNWKFSENDVKERQRWDEYQDVFSEMLSATSTEWAPWYVIPADHKWFARVAVSAVIAHALMEMNPKFPRVSDAARRELQTVKRGLEAEAPQGRATDPITRDRRQKHSESTKKSNARGVSNSQ